ncbi:MAG: Gfo/Idh/MocA family oxidoreductase [Tannerellaceae bacterium]|jgi:predicted dehydrogenase|nr:Gfo/Idh/MocA family oxidoreductase [Tannerellaceae bacterium]
MERRTFLKGTAAALGATGVTGGSLLLGGCGDKQGAEEFPPLKAEGTYYVPNLIDKALEGKPLKAGVVGCGGRGSGAAFNFLAAADDVTITALGDTFGDRLGELAGQLKSKAGISVPEENRFVGLDAYKAVIDSDVDVVILATPPAFRPEHFRYAVEKGKHAFLEKPICIDPVGYRTVLLAAKQAAAKRLSVVTGTQRHHQRSYVASYQQIMAGLIGEITGGNVYWNQSMLWYKDRKPGWREAEWMIRDWVNWKWLSGDHIVEQHVHNIDVFTWFSGLRPVSALGFGSRQRRITGDQYDNFSVDFTMENGIHLHSMCRQIDGTDGKVGEFIQGTRGSWDSSTMEIRDLKGNLVWKYDAAEEETAFSQTNPFVLEHVNWINHIRNSQPIDCATANLTACMAAIMGRESAYTGAVKTWDEMVFSQMDYIPQDLTLEGRMNMRGFTVPIPGKAAE